MDDSSGPVYEKVAKMFLKRYKELIVGKFREASDDQRYARLLQSCSFARELQNSANRLCVIYENAVWHSAVLETLDLELIYASVDAMPRESEEQYADNLVKELLRYFKQEFFEWVNSPSCGKCGENDQSSIGGTGPNSEEAQFDCWVVEQYRCNRCGAITRFPRYNDPIKLLEFRKGRCGEWCNLFTLILKSFGLKTRYVQNQEDHVWCEYYSQHLRRWVHVDSCEQSFDQPYIYSKNWNKSMSYCIAFSHDTVIDVSKRYILQNALPRNQISEDDLQFLCSHLTKKLRSRLDDDTIYQLANRDKLEQLEWYPNKTQDQPTKTLEGPGRQSGSAAWKAQRGEDGKRQE